VLLWGVVHGFVKALVCHHLRCEMWRGLFGSFVSMILLFVVCFIYKESFLSVDLAEWLKQLQLPNRWSVWASSCTWYGIALTSSLYSEFQFIVFW
jgi:hypothetical protein